MREGQEQGLVTAEGGGDAAFRSPGMRADSTGWWPQEDEIDLVDLGVSLWRQKWLMLAIFGLMLLLGVAAALLHGKSYDYSAVVHIGSYTTPRGDVVPIEDSPSALAAMQDAYLPNAIRTYVRQHKGVKPKQIKIDAKSPKDSSVIQLVGKGSTSLGPALLAVEQQAARSLVKDDGRKTDVIRAKLQQ